jgi:uncharacterized surface protein with fasciclin (FAS1) repeats
LQSLKYHHLIRPAIPEVLRHHILPLTLCAAPASEGRLTTADVDGEMVRVSRDDDKQLMVDDRGRVVQEDIVATNGVVHVLDKVLTPKSGELLNTPSTDNCIIEFDNDQY